jgi:hypothetical protein
VTDQRFAAGERTIFCHGGQRRTPVRLFFRLTRAMLRHTTAHFSCCDVRAEVHGRQSRFIKKVNDTAHFFDFAIPRFLPGSN